MNFKKLLFLILSSLAAVFIWVHLFTKNSFAGIIGYVSLLIESIMLIVNAVHLKLNRILCLKELVVNVHIFISIIF